MVITIQLKFRSVATENDMVTNRNFSRCKYNTFSTIRIKKLEFFFARKCRRFTIILISNYLRYSRAKILLSNFCVFR